MCQENPDTKIRMHSWGQPLQKLNTDLKQILILTNFYIFNNTDNTGKTLKLLLRNRKWGRQILIFKYSSSDSICKDCIQIFN